MSELTTLEMRDDVAVITMDDGKANALSHEMLGALNQALDQSKEKAKAVVLAGREGRFCAGFDLKTMMSGPESAVALVSAGAELYLRLYEWPAPVVAACTGHALAGGALLLLVADTRVGAEGDFKIGLNEVAIGLTLPILAQELARDRLSKRHLSLATIGARIYSPTEAVDCGYLDETAEPKGLVETAIARARSLAALPAYAYGRTKQRLRAGTIELIRETLDSDMKSLLPG